MLRDELLGAAAVAFLAGLFERALLTALFAGDFCRAGLFETTQAGLFVCGRPALRGLSASIDF